MSNAETAPDAPDDMLLPDGYTCRDCLHVARCRWLISVDEDNVACDWSPSRFRLRLAP
jgi:hypothetical protein